jgi:hypothetical protein
MPRVCVWFSPRAVKREARLAIECGCDCRVRDAEMLVGRKQLQLGVWMWRGRGVVVRRAKTGRRSGRRRARRSILFWRAEWVSGGCACVPTYASWCAWCWTRKVGKRCQECTDLIVLRLDKVGRTSCGFTLFSFVLVSFHSWYSDLRAIYGSFSGLMLSVLTTSSHLKKQLLERSCSRLQLVTAR